MERTDEWGTWTSEDGKGWQLKPGRESPKFLEDKAARIAARIAQGL